MTVGAGRALFKSPATVAAGASYTGPGDIVTFDAWWGLRAYNSAYATGSNPAIDLHNDSDGSFNSTINILSDGSLDVATAATVIAGGASKIGKIYDQTGGGIHLTQATLALQPTLVLAALGSLPVMRITEADGIERLRGTLGASISQPYSISAVSKRTGMTTSFNSILTGGGFGLYHAPSVDNCIIYAGSVSSNVSAADNTAHTLQAVLNGSSSILMVDGADTTGLAAGASAFGTTVSIGDNAAAANGLHGDATEAGVMTGSFSGTNRTDLDANQSAYWGI